MITPNLLQDRSFVTTWKTDNAGTSTNTQITIPTSSTGTYACQVDWGDGTSSTISTYNDAAWTHTYSVAGTYTVKIYGKFVGFVFNNGGDKAKLLTVSKWGPDFRLGTNQGNYFYGCSNLTITATDMLNTQGTTTFTQAFANCSAIQTIPNINNWNMSAVTSLLSCFSGCSSFNQSLSNWDTGNVTVFSTCFSGCTVYNQSIPWNTIKATAMTGMFTNCLAFNQPINFTTSASLTTLASMMTGCTAFNSSITFSNTSGVTSMAAMFQSCYAFNQPLTGIPTFAAVGTFNSFLQDCLAFNQTINFTTSSSLTTLRNFLAISSVNITGAFNSSITFSNTSGVNNMSGMLQYQTFFNQPLTGIPSTAAVTDMSSMLSHATAFDQDVSQFSIAALTTAASMFTSSGFTKTNYDKLLNNTTGWPSQATIQSNVTFSAGSAHYSAGAPTTGRSILTGTKTWTITDGGTP